MKQQDKELLLKDLSARLPYGVMCQTDEHGKIHKLKGINKHKGIWWYEFDGFRNIKPPKPYLRPMSSMTKEDKEELAAVLGVDYIDNKVVDFGEFLCEGSPVNIEDVYGLLDWLNAHHFDYRGLIGRNLAISTEVFNPYKD